MLFELAGDKKKERALKMVNGHAKAKPTIRTTLRDFDVRIWTEILKFLGPNLD